MTKPAFDAHGRPSAWAVALLAVSCAFALAAAGLLGFAPGVW